MSEELRPLGELIQLVEEMDLQVTYAYDDMVFVEHSAFLFQFSGNGGRQLKLYFNTECPSPDAEQLEQRILALAIPKKLTIRRCGTFSMKQQKDEENLELQFFDM